MISCLPAGACTPRRQAYFVPAFAPCVTAADIRAQESVFCRAPCNLLHQKGKNYMNQTLSLTKLFSELCDEGKFQKIIFSDKRKKSLEYQKVILRPILLGGELCCQAEYTYPKKVTHRNLPLTEAAALCLALCEQDFKQINIFTLTEQIQVLAARPERPAIRRTPQAEQAERGKKLRREGSGSSNDLNCEQTSAAATAILTVKEPIAAAVLIPNSQTVSRPALHCQSRAFLPLLSARPRRPRSRTTAKSII